MNNIKRIYLIILTIVTVFCIILGTIIHFTNFLNFSFNLFNSNNDNNNYTYNEDQTETFDNNITQLNINTSVIDIEILSGSNLSVSYNGSDKLKPNIEQNGQTLSIKQDFKINDLFKSKSNNHDNKIVITLPSDKTLTNININSNVGDFEFKDLKTDNISATFSVGDVSFENCFLQSGNISCDVSDVTLNNCDFKNLSCSCNVGDFKFTNMPNRITATINLSDSVGDIKVNGTKQSHTYNQNGSDNRSITVNSNIGDITIN